MTRICLQRMIDRLPATTNPGFKKNFLLSWDRVECSNMSTYNILPANAHFGTIQTIPVDTRNQLRHAINGVDAATKVTNLNVGVYDGTYSGDNTDIRLPMSLTTFVSQTIEPVTNLPAYLVRVTGGNNEPISFTNLTIAGGFPHTSTAALTVDTSFETSMISTGTMTLYDGTLGMAQPIIPEVYVLNGTTVALTDLNSIPPATINTCGWQVEIPSYYATASLVQFDFSFYLMIKQ